MRPASIWEIPSEASLPTLSRVLHIRGRGHTGMHRRVSRDHELHFVSRGQLVFHIGDVDRIVRAGEVFYSQPGIVYGLSSAAPPDLSCFHCHFSLPGATMLGPDLDNIDLWGTFAHADARATGRERMLCLPELVALRDPRAFAELFLAILHDQRAQRPGDAIAAQARFLLLLRALSHEAIAASGRASRPKATSAQAHAARALDLIERHPGKHTTVSRVAELVGVDPDYLARLFRQQVGCSLGAYVLKRTMSVAQERLLAEPTTTVRLIAKDLGFDDPLYFTRVFRRTVGCSPRDFRNR